MAWKIGSCPPVYWATSQKNSVSILRYTLFPLLSNSVVVWYILLFCIFLHFLQQWWELLFVKKLGLFSSFSPLFSKREILLGLSLVNRQKKNSNCVLDTSYNISNMLALSMLVSMIQGYTYCTWIQMLLLPCSLWHLQAQWRSRANLPLFFPWPSQKLDWGRVKEIGRYYVKGIAYCVKKLTALWSRAYQHQENSSNSKSFLCNKYCFSYRWFWKEGEGKWDSFWSWYV